MGIFDKLFKKKYTNNDQYYMVYNKGVEHHTLKDFKRAIKYYSRAITINPQLHEAYANRASLFGGENDCRNYEKSIKDFNKAIDLFRQTENRTNNSGGLHALYCERGRSKYHTKDFKGSLDDFSKSIEIKDNEEAFLSRGYCYFHRFNDLEAAIIDFNKVVFFDSEYKLQAYTALSLLYYKIAVEKGKTQKFKEAILDLDKAIEFNQLNNVDPQIKQLENCYYNRGLFKSKLNKNSEAIDDFNKVIETSPKDKDAIFNRALNLLPLEDIEGAKKDFELVKKIDPNRKGLREVLESIEALNTIDYNNSEENSFLQNKYSKIPDFNSLESSVDWQDSFNKEHDENLFDYLEFIDKYLKDKNNFTKNNQKDLINVMGDYGKSKISIEGNELVALYNSANDKLLGKDLDGAIKDFSSLITIAPSLAQAYYARGIAYIIKLFTETNDTKKVKYIEFGINDLGKAELLDFQEASYVRHFIQLVFNGDKYFGPESTLWECAKNIYELDNMLKAIAASNFKEKGVIEILKSLNDNLEVFSLIMKVFEKEIDAKKIDSFRNQFYTLKSFFGQVNFNMGVVYTILTHQEVEGISKSEALDKSDEHLNISVKSGNKEAKELLGIDEIFNFNNETLKVAVRDWIEDAAEAETTYGHISNWDTSEVTDMSKMFYQARKFNQDISNWDVSNVTNMSQMFYYATSFNQDISSWDVSNVTDMMGMFLSATAFNQNISSWDVTSVTSMRDMFAYNDIFNQPIGNWDVSNVTNLIGMFYRARKFNQDISNWDVSSVKYMSYMFNGTTSFNQPIGNWDVGNVTGMIKMFSDAIVFNQPLDDWDVSKVTNMNGMFSCSVFNQDISNWDISKVTATKNMFTDPQLIEKYGKNGQLFKSLKKQKPTMKKIKDNGLLFTQTSIKNFTSYHKNGNKKFEYIDVNLEEEEEEQYSGSPFDTAFLPNINSKLLAYDENGIELKVFTVFLIPKRGDSMVVFKTDKSNLKSFEHFSDTNFLLDEISYRDHAINLTGDDEIDLKKYPPIILGVSNSQYLLDKLMQWMPDKKFVMVYRWSYLNENNCDYEDYLFEFKEFFNNEDDLYSFERKEIKSEDIAILGHYDKIFITGKKSDSEEPGEKITKFPGSATMELIFEEFGCYKFSYDELRIFEEEVFNNLNVKIDNEMMDVEGQKFPIAKKLILDVDKYKKPKFI